MRTILRFLFFVILALNTSAGFANKAELKATKDNSKENKMNNAEANRLLSRLHEIRGLAKTDLSKDQKQDLRKEVTNIKQQIQQHRPGYVLYISLTALIIILLLILLL
jgi:hypothetical protein